MIEHRPPKPNLYRELLESVRAHDGDGKIMVHRAFERLASRPDVAFIDLVVLPPGTSIGRHRHGDDEETYLILRGAGLMWLDGEEFRVHAGDVLVNRPYGEHGLVNDRAVDLHLLVFQVGPRDFGGHG